MDTNFLIYCAEKKIDYALEIDALLKEGFDLIIPTQVLEELQNLSEKSPKFSDRTAAWTALKVIKSNNVRIINSRGKDGDEAIFNAVRVGSIVATLDQELREKLKGNNRILVVLGDKKIGWA